MWFFCDFFSRYVWFWEQHYWKFRSRDGYVGFPKTFIKSMFESKIWWKNIFRMIRSLVWFFLLRLFGYAIYFSIVLCRILVFLLSLYTFFDLDVDFWHLNRFKYNFFGMHLINLSTKKPHRRPTKVRRFFPATPTHLKYFIDWS